MQIFNILWNLLALFREMINLSTNIPFFSRLLPAYSFDIQTNLEEEKILYEKKNEKKTVFIQIFYGRFSLERENFLKISRGISKKFKFLLFFLFVSTFLAQKNSN